MRRFSGAFLPLLVMAALSVAPQAGVPAAVAGVHPATDLPKVIPQLEQQAPGLPPPGPNWVISQITVPAGRPAVGEVRIRDLRFAHGQPGNLRFELVSPAGTAVVLFEQIWSSEGWTGQTTGFGLADRSPWELGVASGPPMQLTYRPRFAATDPERRLARFAGEPTAGTWTLKVTDLFGFGGIGTLDAWTLEILRPAVTVAAADVPRDIPDGGPATSTVSGPATGAQVAKVEVAGFQVWHAYPSDLRARVISPDGRSVLLFDEPACDATDWGEDRYPWGFADDPIFPRAGCPGPGLVDTAWAPLGALSDFRGAPASGPWSLRVDDLEAGDEGTLRSWSLRLTLLPDTRIEGGPEAGAVRLVASEPDAVFECAVDGGAFSSCTSPWAVPPMAPGSHTLAARAVDTDAGTDPSPATVSWSVPPAPAAPTPPPAATPRTRPAPFVATDAFRLPSTRACLRRPARLTLAYRRPRGVTVTRIEVWVAGRRLAVRTGDAARRSLKLARLPGRRFKLTIKVTPAGGKAVAATRTYKVCRPA